MSTVYAGGWIVTCDDEGTEHPSGWVLVEDGVVRDVGEGDEPEAEERVDLGRPEVTRIDPDDGAAGIAVDGVLLEAGALPAQRHLELGGGACDEVAHRVLLTRRDDVILRCRLLQHQPLSADVVARVAPIAQRVEIAQV